MLWWQPKSRTSWRSDVLNRSDVSSRLPIPPVNDLPRHVAIVMDGNGRWAARRFLPRIAGHRQGVESLRRMVRACLQQGVQVLTVFAFSSENWKRPEEEVSGLMDILVTVLPRELPALNQQGVALRLLGNRAPLSERVLRAFAHAESATAANQRLTLNICFNYGGRWDMVAAAKAVLASGQELTEDAIARHVVTAEVGDPDLIIRTGGEMRISNFLLWQSAYSELYFSDLLWPDFDEAALQEALHAYAHRERRFGMTSAQVTADSQVT